MYERQQEILKLLREKHHLSVKELSESLYVSEATVRRDLKNLSENNMIIRVRGGAFDKPSSSLEIPNFYRTSINAQEKMEIADLALKLLNNKKNIFMCSSSTCLMLAKKLTEVQDLTVLTNGIFTAHILSESTNVKVFSTGGKAEPKCSSLNGTEACEFVKNFRADIAFVSCRGISLEGVTDYIKDESLLKKTFRKYSKILVLLVDSSKHEQTFIHHTLDFKEIDYVVSDKPFSDNLTKALEENDVTIITP